MKINHHNYEEYFILYMDNELNAEERRMVEAFVQQYPELKEELQVLSQYKLEPDTSVVFKGKEELMKINGETPVSLANYEEWFILYHDNELSESQKKSLERFLLAHPVLRTEFDQFQKAKLEPVQIIFAGKASLYRKEEKTRPLPWFRIAAAAVLLLAISVTAVFIINTTGNKKPGDVLVKKNPQETKSSETNTNNDQVAIVNPGVAIKENNVKEQADKPPVTRIVVNPSYAKQETTPAKKNERMPLQTDVKNEPSNNLPYPEEETLVAVRKPNNQPESFNNPNISNAGLVNNTIANRITSETVSQKTDAIKHAVVTSADTDPSDLEDGKNKSRGLFRKIARTFEKRSGMDPTDDDRLLVAGLSIKLK